MTHTTPQPSSSVTTFDFPSLHLLRHEINVVIKNAEMNLRAFTDDSEQAHLLLDSIEVLEQLASILDLLSLDGGSDLANAIAKTLQLLYDKGDNLAEHMISDIPEAIIILNRYIDFVLLKEILAPSLLLPIINKLHQHLDIASLDRIDFINRQSSTIFIFDAKTNYQALSELELEFDIKKLLSAYRAGLNVLLKNKTATVTVDERKKLQAMQYACECISNKSESLFWQAVTVAVTDIEKILPLKEKDKHTLIFVEQMFLNYVSVNHRSFADLVSFACHRNNSLAQDMKQLYIKNSLTDEQLQVIKKQLFAPSYQVITTVNGLIQEKINQIKEDADTLARQEKIDNKASIEKIVTELQTVGSTLALLNLDKASQVMKKQAQIVSQWQAVSAENIGKFLLALIIAENASINLLKKHTIGATYYPLYNKAISLHQLNTSYDIILTESRKNLIKVEQAINDYIKEGTDNKELLVTIPELLHEVIGALNFLNLTKEMQMIVDLENYLKQDRMPDDFNQENLGYIANIIMAVDYQLSNLENNLMVSKQARNIGQQSLNQLLVA